MVLVLLGEQPPRALSQRELLRALQHLSPRELAGAVARLDVDGVLERRGELLWPSRPTCRLEQLGLIAV